MSKRGKSSAANITYNVASNVPLTGWTNFDPSTPEYVTMSKMKIDQSFPFEEKRKSFVNNTRTFLMKNNGMNFAVRQERDSKTKLVIPGIFRVWRVTESMKKGRGKSQ